MTADTSRLGGWSVILYVVTIVAALLSCKTHGQTIQFHLEHPLLGLEDPPKALFHMSERERRVIRPNALLAFFNWGCLGCSAERNGSAWEELIEAQERLIREGEWLPPANAGDQLADAKAAAIVSRASFGNAAAIAQLSELSDHELPFYARERARELRAGEADGRRTGARPATGADFALPFAELVLLIGAVVLGIRLRRTEPPEAPQLFRLPPTRAILVFVWSLAIMGAVLYGNVGLGFEALWRRLLSLPLCIAVIVLLVVTRAPGERPVQSLVQMPSTRRQWLGCLSFAVFAVGASLAFDRALWLAGGALGIDEPWTHSFDELLVFGSGADVVLSFVDLVVLAPLGEELAFRGVLFGLLTHWTGERRAALLSGAIFSAYHGFGVLGFLEVAFSGYLWARIYARSGSLLPGMLAHGVTNLLFFVSGVAARD